jgi:hypothetical protein
MKTRIPLRAAVTLSLVIAVSSLGTLSGANSSAPLVLHGDGLALALLGSREAVAQSALVKRLGSPTKALSSTPALENCGVTAIASWRSLSAYFDRGRLVGLSFGPVTTPSVVTSLGLRLGDTIQVARSLYGKALRLSKSQGGAWFVKTSDGRLDGFLRPSNGRPGPTSRILTIDVGDVGCPAMSP